MARAAGNEREVLVLVFDDQEDLQSWGKVPLLMSLIEQVHALSLSISLSVSLCFLWFFFVFSLPVSLSLSLSLLLRFYRVIVTHLCMCVYNKQYFGSVVFTPRRSAAADETAGPRWVSLHRHRQTRHLCQRSGLRPGHVSIRVLQVRFVVTLHTHTSLMAHPPRVLYRYGPLFDGWSESSPDDLHTYPDCTLRGLHTQTGQLLRVVDGDLAYGPFYNESTDGNIVPSNMYTYVQCGVNWASMDQARPELVAAGA